MNIKDIDISKDLFTKYDIEVCENFLFGLKENHKTTSLVSYMALGERDENSINRSHSNIGAPCHGGIIQILNYFNSRPILVASMTKNYMKPARNDALDPLKDKFLDYFLNRSCYSRFIVNKDNFDFIKNHGIIVRTDLPLPLLQNVLIMSRHALEHSPYAFIGFNTMVEMGLPEDVAFILCFNTTISDTWKSYEKRNEPITTDGYFKKVNKFQISDLNSTIIRSYTVHRVHGLLTYESMFNFIKGEISNPTSEFERTYYSRQSTTYYGGCCCFDTEQKRNSIESFNSYLLALPKLQEALSDYRKTNFNNNSEKIINPFAPVRVGENIPPKPYELSVQEVMEVFVPFVIENKIFN